jgi:hypothetical protein
VSIGWFLVNIVAPLCLPVFGMLPLKLLPLTPVAPPGSLRLMTTVKDGQLCWAVVGMSAAAIYEVLAAQQPSRTMQGMTGYVLAVTLVLMLPAMMIAAGGAVFTTPLPTAPHPRGLRGWLSHYKVFAGSLIMSMIAAICYTVLHSAGGLP